MFRNNLIINIKDTCVLSIIGTVELFYTTKGVAGALYTYFESFTIAMVIYFIMTFTCSRILRASAIAAALILWDIGSISTHLGR